MKQLLLTTLMALACTTLHAQTALRYGAEVYSQWGEAGTMTPYVKFPADMVKPFAGNDITEVKLSLAKNATNVYVYIKNDPKDSQNLYREKVGDLEAGDHVITLTTPFHLDGNEISIGYKATFAQSGGVCVTEDRTTLGDYVYYNSNNKWTTTGHCIALQAVVNGDDMPSHLLALTLNAEGNTKVPYGAETVTFNGSVRNMGTATIDSYELQYDINGTYADPMTMTQQMACNDSYPFSITVPATEVGAFTLTVCATKADGVTNSYDGYDTASALFTVRDPEFKRRMICEEMTGLWCGWCPRGLVGLELMKEKYRDEFYPISVHTLGSGIPDPMVIDDAAEYNYQKFINNEAGAPACNINRKQHGDPFYDIERLIALEQNADNHVAYTMTAEWNADSTQITTHSTFYTDIDIANPAYRMAFTVTEDGIKGEDLYQTNYYANGKNGDFYGWEKKDDYTNDVVFNDVARGIFSSYDGDQCTDGDITAYQQYTYTYTFTVPPTVTDKKQIHVIGQIIQPATGYVLNAYSTVPTKGETSGISHTMGCTPAVSTTYHDITGAQVQNPAHGMFIKHSTMPDGSVITKKVIKR